MRKTLLPHKGPLSENGQSRSRLCTRRVAHDVLMCALRYGCGSVESGGTKDDEEQAAANISNITEQLASSHLLGGVVKSGIWDEEQNIMK